MMKQKLYITGLLGLLAAITVGTGEYLLHYDSQARFSEGGFDFMQGISAHRSTLGHFFGVFGATLYPIGCYHIYLMLKPANNKVAFTAFLISAFGCIVGAVWIGSRASVSALMQLPETAEITNLIALYELRYETLLQVTRITTLILSIIFASLILTGKSHYKKWMAIVNPAVLIVFSFIIYLMSPHVGKHIMPIALNVAFFTLFTFSLLQTKAINEQEGNS